MKTEVVESSFRDPSGSVFYHDKTLYRRINFSYKENFDHLINSGLYDELRRNNLIIGHEESTDVFFDDPDFYKLIRPTKIPFISYPYEWCFSQLKDAALVTLSIQKKALLYGMSLKDGSAYNIQFHNGKPIHIDTLSFEMYNEGSPWIAYRQFCQHFLAPLALMSYKDVRLSELLKVYIDGIPLDLASKLLPGRTFFKFSILSHIHLHAKSQVRFSDKNLPKNSRKISKQSMLGLIDNLEYCVLNLKWNPNVSVWSGYYNDNTYTDSGLQQKMSLINSYIDEIQPSIVWDLGANTGLFSRVVTAKGVDTVSFDIDHTCVELNYRKSIQDDDKNLLPLVMDLGSPSPGIGWSNEERLNLAKRGPADLVLSLALIHHLAISNNIPLQNIASYFQTISKHLIIEFVPKTDVQVQRLLRNREDIFNRYTPEEFEKIFSEFYIIKRKNMLHDSQRILYLMIKR
jgi:ribosomal protein L11 methylase PrmA